MLACGCFLTRSCVSPDSRTSAAPPLSGVLETVLYFSDQDRSEAFYSGVLGLRLLDKEPGRSLFYRAGSSVLLLFHPGASRAAGRLPAHGAEGAVHVCFRVPRPAYGAWKAHLRAREIGLLEEVRWSNGHSFYFRDPDGNLLEIADADIWPA